MRPLALLLLLAAPLPAAERPNVLFLFADDWGRQLPRAYAKLDAKPTA